MLERIIDGIGNRLLKLANQIKRHKNIMDLTGDRDVEWSWVMANLPHGENEVLDFGCGPNPICSYVAARLGATVTAFDINEIKLTGMWDQIIPVKGDILNYDFGNKKYDVIINCSVIEHVGLGKRYGEPLESNSDIEAMSKLKGLTQVGGKMILTIPVGKDAIHAPWHRVYGHKRLPMLLEDWEIQKSEFWAKNSLNIWCRVSMDEALNVLSSPRYYALGLFVLTSRLESKSL